MKKIFAISLLFLIVVFFSGCTPNKKTNLAPTPTPTSSVKMVKPGEGPEVTLTPDQNKQLVMLKITKISADIKKIDYELVYNTNNVQRGVLGTLDLKAGEDFVEKKILLGSCSKNICVYDKNVTNLQLTVKFTGQAEPLEFQKEYSL